MNREYWRRVWINQEVALTKEVIILCGGKSESLDLIEQALRSLEFCSHNCRHRYLGLTSDLAYMGWGITTKLPLLTRRLRQQGENIPLSRLLYDDSVMPMPQTYTASDPRDIIFDLLGVITDNDKLGIQANYRLSTREVFTTATRAMYDYDPDRLNIDTCTPSHKYQGELPSWVIDWQAIGPESCDQTNQRICFRQRTWKKSV